MLTLPCLMLPLHQGPLALSSPGAAAFLKHPRTPPGAPGMDYQTADSEHLMKRIRSGQSDEVSFSGSTFPNIYSPDDLPKTVVRNLNQGSSVMSMDFHPQQQTFLLVGTNVGDISIWEVGSRERLAHKPFKVWDLSACTMPLQTALVKDATISVNRCIWGPDGSILGVAFSKHIVQIYTYNPAGELRQHLEIDAHVGGVNDIAFAHPNKQLCIVTCGDDKTIKVWDAVAGRRQYIFEGHEAPVYSVCPHYKENIQFNKDQTHLLVVHESQIAIYDSQLELLRSWYPRDSLSAAISSAIYSCDGLLIFTGFCDGAIGVFDADSLRLRCRIAPSAYISSSIASNGSSFPVVIAAHPSEPNQIALGMSDGAVHVIEPSDAEPKWGSSVPQENGALPSVASNSALNNSQPSETPSR